MLTTCREFISLAAAVGLSVALAPLAFAQPAAIRVRQNINTFRQDQSKVDALRLAVRTMKQRSAAQPNDAMGWNYWASSHGTPDPVPAALRNIYRQCDHSGDGYTALHFLSWHRAFLYFFESVLKRAARDVGSTTEFELPYWDWYTQPVYRGLCYDRSGKNPRLWIGGIITLSARFILHRAPETAPDVL